MLTVKVIEARSLEPVCVKGRRWLQDRTSPQISSFVAVHHGSQSKMTHFADKVDNPHWDSVIELWDREVCETLEFIVVVRAGGLLWKHSMATLNMEQFRTQPELRVDIWVLLGSVSRRNLGTSLSIQDSTFDQPKAFGELHLAVTYTEDCNQPTFLQSVFCNVMNWPLPSIPHCNQNKRLPQTVPRISRSAVSARSEYYNVG